MFPKMSARGSLGRSRPFRQRRLPAIDRVRVRRYPAGGGRPTLGSGRTRVRRSALFGAVGKVVENAADQAGLGDERDHAHERAAARAVFGQRVPNSRLSDRSLRDRLRNWCGRDGRGLQGAGHAAESNGGDQGAAAAASASSKVHQHFKREAKIISRLSHLVCHTFATPRTAESSEELENVVTTRVFGSLLGG